MIVVPLNEREMAEEAADGGLTLEQLAAVNRNLDIWADWMGRERPDIVTGEGHLAESASGSMGWDQIADREERRIADITSLCVSELPKVEKAVILEEYANKQAGADVFRWRAAPRDREQRLFARASAKWLLYWMMARRHIVHALQGRQKSKGRAFSVAPGTVNKLRKRT